MSEGKLQRRLNLADRITQRWGAGYRTFIALDTMEKAIEEAKEDFPIPEVKWHVTEGGSEFTIKFPSDKSKLVACMTEILSWFVENFGEKTSKVSLISGAR